MLSLQASIDSIKIKEEWWNNLYLKMKMSIQEEQGGNVCGLRETEKATGFRPEGSREAFVPPWTTVYLT